MNMESMPCLKAPNVSEMGRKWVQNIAHTLQAQAGFFCCHLTTKGLHLPSFLSPDEIGVVLPFWLASTCSFESGLSGSDAEAECPRPIDPAGHHQGTWCWCLKISLPTLSPSLLLTPHPSPIVAHPTTLFSFPFPFVHKGRVTL